MNLFQTLTMLEILGYDRYRLEGDSLGWPEKTTRSLFKPGKSEPDIVATGPYGLQALRLSPMRAREKEAFNENTRHKPEY